MAKVSLTSRPCRRGVSFFGKFGRLEKRLNLRMAAEYSYQRRETHDRHWGLRPLLAVVLSGLACSFPGWVKFTSATVLTHPLTSYPTDLVPRSHRTAVSCLYWSGSAGNFDITSTRRRVMPSLNLCRARDNFPHGSRLPPNRFGGMDVCSIAPLESAERKWRCSIARHRCTKMAIACVSSGKFAKRRLILRLWTRGVQALTTAPLERPPLDHAPTVSPDGLIWVSCQITSGRHYLMPLVSGNTPPTDAFGAPFPG